MKTWLRVNEGLTFAFSISFFLFIMRGNRQLEALNAIIYTLILIAFIAGAILTWIFHGLSKCQDTAYAKMAMTLSIINFIFAFLMLVGHQALYCLYPRRNKRLPAWLVGNIVEKKQRGGQIRPADGKVNENDKLVDVSTTLKDQIPSYDTDAEFLEELKLATKLCVILFVSRSAPNCQQLAGNFANLAESKKDSVHFGFVSQEVN